MLELDEITDKTTIGELLDNINKWTKVTNALTSPRNDPRGLGDHVVVWIDHNGKKQQLYVFLEEW